MTLKMDSDESFPEIGQKEQQSRFAMSDIKRL